VLDDVRTPTLFGGGRVVVVEDAGEMLRGSLEAFAAYAERPAPGALLVLVAGGLDGRLKGARQLREAAEVIPCESPRPWELARWARERARDAYGLQASDAAASALRRLVGADLGLLDAALARLRDQIAPRIYLRPDDIERSTADHRSPAIFEPGNALDDGDLRAGLTSIASAFDEGIRIHEDVVSEEGAVAAILLDHMHRAYVRLLRYHLHRKFGATEEDAARRAGCSPKQVPFFLPKARQHSLQTLVSRHRHFAEADAALKGNGVAGGRQVLEKLVLALLG
jgi:DNA polymerase-3 subunit delta